MKLRLSIIPILRFCPTKKYAKCIYSLGMFSYGQFLLYDENEPVYYLNILEEKYNELSLFISSVQNIEVAVKKVSQANNMSLTLSPKVFGITLWNREKVIDIDIPEFPIQLWENYKKTLNKKTW